MRKQFLFAVFIICFPAIQGVFAQQQETYTFCTGSSYAYLFDTAASSSSNYFGRWVIGQTPYTAHFQKDTIYASFGTGTGTGGYASVKKWACTSTTTATCVWTYTSSNMHHDLCPLPNGNVLVLVRETKTAAQMQAVGANVSSGTYYFDIIREIHPTGTNTGTIVWEWKLFDHLCQSFSSSYPNYYSNVAYCPQRWNVNCNLTTDGFHPNGLDYNPTLDQIVFSSHNQDELFVIDHSTTTAQAATSAGGNAGKGGDFLYRWGKPQNYNCTTDGNGITLNVIHDARWVPATNSKWPNYISCYHNNGGAAVQAVLHLPPYNGYNYSYTVGQVIGPVTPVLPVVPLITGISNLGGCMVGDNGNIIITKPNNFFRETNGVDDSSLQNVPVATVQADRLKKCEVRYPTASASVSNSSICVNTPITLGVSATSIFDASPVFSYSWASTPAGCVSTSQNPTVTPTTAGNYTYTVTVTNNIGCTASASVNVVVGDAAASAGVSIAANPSGAICSGASVTFTATPTNGGTSPSYQWKKDGAAISGATSATYTSSSLASGNVITCEMISNQACISGSPATSNPITVTVNSSVAASVTIAANPAGTICSGASVLFTAIPANGGTSPTYQWKLNGTDITGATSATYTSSLLTNGNVITCTMTSNLACVTSSPATSNGITMSVITSLPASVTISSTPSGEICSGTPVVFLANPFNGGISPLFQWKLNGTDISGATSSTYTSSALAAGNVITCKMTSNLGCVTGSPATSSGITMSVISSLPASVTIAANPCGPVCSGTSVTFTATPTNGGASPAYQWKKNGANIIGATSSTYTSSSVVSSDVYTCVMASNQGCVTGSPVTSNAVSVIVNSSLAASVSIAASPTSAICPGTNVTFTATPSNGGSAPAYQWKLNGTNISGATCPTYTSYSLVNNDIVSCTMTSNQLCVTGSPATSNGITMSVTSFSVASVGIDAHPSGDICSGTTVTFIATPANGGTIPAFQWKRNGANISGATSPTYSTDSLENNDMISCTMTSNQMCVLGSPATSNGITMSITSSSVASVGIDAHPAGDICSGSSVTFTAMPTNGGTSPAYQWKLNGTDISGATGHSYVSSSLVNSDVITCVMTSNQECVTGSPATSDGFTMNVTASLPASISITADPAGAICTGTHVTFTAAANNEGTSPTYQWKKNGANIYGATSSTYTSASLTTGDVITCMLTSNQECVTGSPATSNSITMTVNSSLPASVSIVADPSGDVCAGAPVTFSAQTTNGGTNPLYIWKKNGIIITGSNGSTYSSSSLASGDMISCEMTSGLGCVTGSPASSNTITMHVDSVVAGSLSIDSDPAGAVCAGTNVTYTATPTNGGTAPTYLWSINGVAVTGATSSAYSTASLMNNDVITCVMTSNHDCVTGSPATSNPIMISVNPILNASVSIAADPAGAICMGVNVTFTATATNEGTSPAYQWKKNGTDISGATNSAYSSASIEDGYVISCVMTSDLDCVLGSPATSNAITMSVSPILPANANITASTLPACEGQPVAFTLSPVNGGASPVFQWQRNGTNVGSNSTSYLDSTLSDGDIIRCLMFSSELCASGSPVNSNLITATIYDVPQTPFVIQSGDSLISSSVTGNQWYFRNILGSLLINGATNQAYIPVLPGEYYTIVTGTGGCVSDTSNIIYYLFTAIDENDNLKVEIYPNPTSGIINFNYGSNGRPYFVSIYNSLGENLMENIDPSMIDLSLFESGIYYIKVISDNIIMVNKKIILIK